MFVNIDPSDSQIIVHYITISIKKLFDLNPICNQLVSKVMTILCYLRTLFANEVKRRNQSIVWTQTLRKFCDQNNAENVGDKSHSDGTDDQIKVIYVSKSGQRTEVKGRVGDNAMHLAQRNDIEIEGACEASLACCTCHVYVDHRFAAKLNQPKEEEEDLLDMAPFLKPDSRLSMRLLNVSIDDQIVPKRLSNNLDQRVGWH